MLLPTLLLSVQVHYSSNQWTIFGWRVLTQWYRYEQGSCKDDIECFLVDANVRTTSPTSRNCTRTWLHCIFRAHLLQVNVSQVVQFCSISVPISHMDHCSSMGRSCAISTVKSIALTFQLNRDQHFIVSKLLIASFSSRDPIGRMTRRDPL